MDIQHKLIKYFQAMVFNKKYLLVLLAVVSVICSCKRAEEATNRSYLVNNTNDTIYCKMFGYWPFAPSREYVVPQEKILIGNGQYTQFEYIKSLSNEGDSIVFYNKSDTVIWYAPLQKLPDSIHSFYNENSWNIEYGGRNNKYEIATFTITEDDFKKNDCRVGKGESHP